MSTGLEANDRLIPTLWHEVCDKCGTRMDRGGGWLRAVDVPVLPPGGRDRPRPQAGGRYQLHRGHPWRWSARAFRT